MGPVSEYLCHAIAPHATTATAQRHFVAHDGTGGETPVASATRASPALVNATVPSVPIAVIHTIPYSGIVSTTRVTDQKAIDATSMVLNGLINTKLLALCREMNIDAVGISGVDAGLIRAHKRAPVKIDGETVDYGFVGDIDAIDTNVVNKLLDNGLMPIVSPLSCDDNGTLLNINGDTVAAAIGAALSAEKLMLCTGAPGILERFDDPSSIISYTDLAGLKRLREENKIVDGMLPKAKAIEEAIRGGVRRVHVMSYKSPEGILAEVFTNEGAGTLIVADVNALSPAEQQSGK